MDQRAAPAMESTGGDRVVPAAGGFGPHSRGHRLPVRRDLDLAGHSSHPAGFLQGVGRANHHLGRQAGPVGTFTAHQGRFDAQHLQPGIEQAQRKVFAARADTQDDHIHFRVNRNGRRVALISNVHVHTSSDGSGVIQKAVVCGLRMSV
jgi:hypothetical protein